MQLGKKPWQGHREGARKLRQVLKWATEYPKIREVSVFALSEDNFRRSPQEIKELWRIYKQEFGKIPTDEFVHNNGIRVRIVGNEDLWLPSMKTLAKEIIKTTGSYTDRVLNLLLAYSSRFELGRALAQAIKKGKKTWKEYLLVSRPLDLLVRTGNQFRLSNFMLLQAGYAEILFERKLWPEITKRDFDRWIAWYYRQAKNFGR